MKHQSQSNIKLSIRQKASAAAAAQLHHQAFPLRSSFPQIILLLLLLLLILVPQNTFAFTPLTMSSSSNNNNSPIPNRLQELGITLREPPTPKGNYVSCVQSGNLLYVCGHIPQKDDMSLYTGTLGQDLTIEQGYESAKICAINILATLQQYVKGDWKRIKKIIKVVGFVQCTTDFTQQPAVINGASDLFVNVLGKEIGQHARSAVGTNALPLNIATEIECIVEIE